MENASEIFAQGVGGICRPIGEGAIAFLSRLLPNVRSSSLYRKKSERGRMCVIKAEMRIIIPGICFIISGICFIKPLTRVIKEAICVIKAVICFIKAWICPEYP